MDIMELGAIGELVGGVAVIGSLLYVGLQVRQSEAERLRFNLLWVVWLQGTEQTFEGERIGVQDAGFSRPYRLFLRGMLATSEGRAWWAQMENYFSPAFQRDMRQMGSEGSEPLAAAFRSFWTEGGPGAHAFRLRLPTCRRGRDRPEVLTDHQIETTVADDSYTRFRANRPRQLASAGEHAST